MKRSFAIFGAMILAVGTGIVAGQFCQRSPICRDAIGRLLGRGHLVALVHGSGIYEIDVQREIESARYAAGEKEVGTVDRSRRLDCAKQLVAEAPLRRAAQRQSLSAEELDQQNNIIRSQYRDEKIWAGALRRSDLDLGEVRDRLGNGLRERKWLEQSMRTELSISDEECRGYYQTHLVAFTVPLRLHARHLFLAAPLATPPEVVEAKRNQIEELASRLDQGEDFAQLVAEASEDEATKTQGGDLGVFSSWRMPPEFFGAVEKLKVGETGKPLRSHLGFHLVQLIGREPARKLSFEEVRPQIANALKTERRRALVQERVRVWESQADYFRVL